MLILEDSPIVGEVAPHESHQRVSAKGLELIVFLDRWADENRVRRDNQDENGATI